MDACGYIKKGWIVDNAITITNLSAGFAFVKAFSTSGPKVNPSL